jgi:hypothetical protein
VPDIDTTPSTPDNNPTDNWQQRYTGLQKVVATRDADLHTANAALDTLRLEHEQALARIAEYDQQAVDASEEEQARQTYEQLRERFETAPPTPIGNNPARPTNGWADDDDGPTWGGRERVGDSAGYPI